LGLQPWTTSEEEQAVEATDKDLKQKEDIN